MTAPPIAAVSFDLDGTLVDTAAEIAEAANLALAEHGFARRPVEQITLLIGAGTRELMLRLLAQTVIADGMPGPGIAPDAVLASLERHYEATAGTTARPYPGCVDALEALRAAGIRLACVTNKESRYAQRVLQRTGLDGYFELLVGGDTLAQKKPHPDVLRHVADALGCAPSRLVHVGDSRLDVEAARNAGVGAWAVSYGYNAGVPIAAARPERLFDSLAEVAAQLLAPAQAPGLAPALGAA